MVTIINHEKFDYWFAHAVDYGHTANGLALKVGAVPRTLERYTWRNFNDSPRALLRQKWMADALFLVANLGSAKEAGNILKFSHSPAFTRAFVRAFGMAPMRYVRSQ